MQLIILCVMNSEYNKKIITPPEAGSFSTWMSPFCAKKCLWNYNIAVHQTITTKWKSQKHNFGFYYPDEGNSFHCKIEFKKLSTFHSNYTLILKILSPLSPNIITNVAI